MSTFPALDLAEAAAPPPPAASQALAGRVAERLSAYPNPSAGSTTVALVMPSEGTATVALHDALGRRVATLHDGPLAEGQHAFALAGAGLAPGLYLVTARLTGADGATQSEAVRWTRAR